MVLKNTGVYSEDSDERAASGTLGRWGPYKPSNKGVGAVDGVGRVEGRDHLRCHAVVHDGRGQPLRAEVGLGKGDGRTIEEEERNSVSGADTNTDTRTDQKSPGQIPNMVPRNQTMTHPPI